MPGDSDGPGTQAGKGKAPSALQTQGLLQVSCWQRPIPGIGRGTGPALRRGERETRRGGGLTSVQLPHLGPGPRAAREAQAVCVLGLRWGPRSLSSLLLTTARSLSRVFLTWCLWGPGTEWALGACCKTRTAAAFL